MEFNFALSDPRSTNYSSYGQPANRNLVEAFDPAVQLRETRSSYFLDVNLPGLRKEDVWLQMDNARTLMIRGQRYLHEMGMVGWTWHLLQRGSSRRRPFKIPNDVNLPAVRASFRQGVLHVVMPKFRSNRFSPYQVNNRSAQDCSHHQLQLQLQLYPPIGPATLHPRSAPLNPQPPYAEEGEQSGKEIVTMCEAEDLDNKLEGVHVEMESFQPGHPQDISEISVVITVEIPPQDCASSEHESVQDLIKNKEEEEEEKEKEEEAFCVSPSDNPRPDNSMEEQDTDQICEAPGLDSKEEIVKKMETREPIHTCPSFSDTSTVSNVREEEVKTPREEEEKGKVETVISGDERVKSDSEPALRKGLSHLFSSIAELAARKFRRG